MQFSFGHRVRDPRAGLPRRRQLRHHDTCRRHCQGNQRAGELTFRKVFQLLARAGLVSSHRGVKGGFSLARARGGDHAQGRRGGHRRKPSYTCLKTARGCSLDEACPVSSAFAAARQKMAEVLEATSIHDLARGISKRSASWLKVTECA